jgi:hypothetical protein
MKSLPRIECNLSRIDYKGSQPYMRYIFDPWLRRAYTLAGITQAPFTGGRVVRAGVRDGHPWTGYPLVIHLHQ